MRHRWPWAWTRIAGKMIKRADACAEENLAKYVERKEERRRLNF
jgi:hypothetical protein